MAKDASETNNYSAEIVQDLVSRIEGTFEDLDSARGRYMQECGVLRKRIAGIYDEAKARGVPKKELRTFVSARMTMAKARKLLDELEDDQRETVELLAEAFGDSADLPLFRAKLDSVGKSEAA